MTHCQLGLEKHTYALHRQDIPANLSRAADPVRDMGVPGPEQMIDAEDSGCCRSPPDPEPFSLIWQLVGLSAGGAFLPEGRAPMNISPLDGPV